MQQMFQVECLPILFLLLFLCVFFSVLIDLSIDCWEEFDQKYQLNLTQTECLKKCVFSIFTYWYKQTSDESARQVKCKRRKSRIGKNRKRKQRRILIKISEWILKTELWLSWHQIYAVESGIYQYTIQINKIADHQSFGLAQRPITILLQLEASLGVWLEDRKPFKNSKQVPLRNGRGWEGVGEKREQSKFK